ncbi:hypothetical protein JL721_4002 [Aureococcus anophagefferens]|nr:hypothetical protein JL721_4002 [Aureococcus anophagefferens]
MGAASSLANAAVEQLSGEELVAARAQVQDHVGRLEADNAALKARVALLEGDAAAARARQACAATDAAPRAVTPEDREQLPPGLEGLAPWSAAVEEPDAEALAAALAAHPEDERCAAALEARALAAARAVTGEFERRAAADGVVALRRGRRIGRRRLPRRLRRHVGPRRAALRRPRGLRRRGGALRGPGRAGAARAAGVAELVSGAARTKERFDAHFRALGDVAGVACDPPAALKKVARIVEKVVALGSPARVFDVLRCAEINHRLARSNRSRFG